MEKIFIKSLNVEISNQKIITDIDDCIFYTSREIAKNRLCKKKFWFDENVYEQYKNIVFENAELTDWGKEILILIENGFIKDYQFITASKNRMDILVKKLKIEERFISQNMSDFQKITYLNTFKQPSLYVDDKLTVISQIHNQNITKINYPKTIVAPRNFYNNRFRKRF